MIPAVASPLFSGFAFLELIPRIRPTIPQGAQQQRPIIPSTSDAVAFLCAFILYRILIVVRILLLIVILIVVIVIRL